jgi:hypothetical protein
LKIKLEANGDENENNGAHLKEKSRIPRENRAFRVKIAHSDVKLYY